MPPGTPPPLAPEDIEAAALAVRRSVAPEVSLLEQWPISRLLERAARLVHGGRLLEVRACRLLGLPRHRWAMSWIEHSGVAYMAFNKEAWDELKADVPRSRWSFAHELGHVVLHHELLAQGSLDFHEQHPDDRGIEAEANTFAANLLMPAAALERLQQAGADLSPIGIADRFGVSLRAAEIRRRERF